MFNFFFELLKMIDACTLYMYFLYNVYNVQAYNIYTGIDTYES